MKLVQGGRSGETYTPVPLPWSETIAESLAWRGFQHQSARPPIHSANSPKTSQASKRGASFLRAHTRQQPLPHSAPKIKTRDSDIRCRLPHTLLFACCQTRVRIEWTPYELLRVEAHTFPTIYPNHAIFSLRPGIAIPDRRTPGPSSLCAPFNPRWPPKHIT